MEEIIVQMYPTALKKVETWRATCCSLTGRPGVAKISSSQMISSRVEPSKTASRLPDRTRREDPRTRGRAKGREGTCGRGEASRPRRQGGQREQRAEPDGDTGHPRRAGGHGRASHMQCGATACVP